MLTPRYLAMALAALLAVGCGTVRETLPARSAMEQLLISTAADRAVAKLSANPFQGRTVFLDTTNLDCLDKTYVIQRLRTTLRQSGAKLADAKDQADLILEAGSGALSMNKRDVMLGLPSLPIPIPYGGETLKFPEVPIWKSVTYRSHAKFLFSLVDAKTGEPVGNVPVCYGKSKESYWWCLIVGPIKSSDLPEEAR